ncbi:cation transporter/ATPase [Baffinella frigidus]|nr:cation transporter/ATPase [Cryptophyta sp. CCMP2293]
MANPDSTFLAGDEHLHPAVAPPVALDEDETKWHSVGIEDTLKLQCTSWNGLSSEEALRRLEKYGKNELTPPPKTSFLYRVFLQVNNILIAILAIAAVISGEFSEVILIVLVVSAGQGFVRG